MKKRYLGLLAMSTVLTLGLVAVNEHNSNVVDAEEQTATLSFADKANRTAYSTTQQVWEQNGITVTNDKASSTSNVGDYSNPARFYKSSSLTVAFTQNFTSIVFDCNNATYASDLATALNNAGVSNSVSSDKVTVNFASSVDTFTVSLSAAKVFMDSISVTYSEEEISLTATQKVNKLFTSYYNNGSYQRDTVINMNQATMEELITCFHAGNIVAERTTYFEDDSLWMSNEAGTYSYYGTKGTDMTSARVAEAYVKPANPTIAASGYTMEEYYTTMYDIKDNTAEWTEKSEGVYTTSDLAVVKQFLDFTAPCFLGLSGDKANYFTLSSVEVEEVDDSLELRLITSGDQGKLTDANGVLSVATISKHTATVTVNNIYDAINAKESDKVNLTNVTVSEIYNAWDSGYGNMAFYVTDGVNRILVYRASTRVGIGDVVNVSGLITIYSGTGMAQIAQGSTVEFVTKHICSFGEPTCLESATCIHCGVEGDAALGHTEANEEGKCDRCGTQLVFDQPIVELATFALGANGSASHKDGSSAQSTYSENVGGYTLSITGGNKMYPSSYDAKGNSCLKFGTSSAVGSMTFTVPENVTEVVIYVAKYKSNTTKVSVNGTTYTLTKNSNNGEYDAIVVDTSSTKTVTFTTVKGGYRCMINTIEFKK